MPRSSSAANAKGAAAAGVAVGAGACGRVVVLAARHAFNKVNSIPSPSNLGTAAGKAIRGAFDR